MTKLKRLSLLVATLLFGAQGLAATFSPFLIKNDAGIFVPVPDRLLVGNGAETSRANGGNKPVAVLFTDVKFDDKLAIHVLSNSNRYERVIAVITAVADQDGAHGDLLDFMQKMNAKETGRSPVELQVLKVDNIIGKPVAHEINFLGRPKATLNYVDMIREYTKYETLEIFQIAPVAREHLHNLIGMAEDITLFHLLHGYNSSGNGDGEEVERFVSSIGATIQEKFPKALIAITNNYGSFVNGQGSTQPYVNFLGRVPLEHLDAAANDPFHYLQFVKAMNAVEDAKLYVVADQLKRAAQLIPNWESISPQEEPFTPTLLMEAKNDPAKRDEYIKFIDAAMKQLCNARLGNAKDFLKNEGALNTPYMEYLEGRKPMKELHDALRNPDWTAALNEVEEVVSVSKKMIDHDESRTLANLIYAARKNERGQETEDLRTVFLAFMEAVTPVVEKVRGDRCWRWLNAVPKAFKDTEMTVEVCDANHVVVVLEAVTNPYQFKDMIFVNEGNALKFKTEDLGEVEPHGKTLTELTSAESFELMEPYLL